MNIFDKKAGVWDEDPERVARAQRCADRLVDLIEMKQVTRAMEYGSGTGLLSFALMDRIKDIILMDESEKMTEQALMKCRSGNIKHIRPIQINLLEDSFDGPKFDLIYTLLTLHHVQDVSHLLGRFSALMNVGGQLAIIDLEHEDGSFHDHSQYVHRGFKQSELENLLDDAGIHPWHYEVAFTIKKSLDGDSKEFPAFLMMAKKVI